MNTKLALNLALLLSALVSLGTAGALRAEVILHHVHGLAFTADGKSLMVPAHIGLAVYRDGRWAKVFGPAHDFMGFSLTEKSIYTSGHPAPDSPLRNPLGLIKSADGGATWQQLSLAGESDFHLMAAGYRSNVVYVVNPERNSRMPQPGIYFTRDDGKSWKRAALAGLSERITSIAVHPADAGRVALGTLDGLYVSDDFGAQFRRVGQARAVTAVQFDLDGKHVYFAPTEGAALEHVALDTRKQDSLALPTLARDFVTYIAQNPANQRELAIATRQRHVYLSRDSGKTWQQIARQGENMPHVR